MSNKPKVFVFNSPQPGTIYSEGKVYTVAYDKIIFEIPPRSKKGKKRKTDTTALSEHEI